MHPIEHISSPATSRPKRRARQAVTLLGIFVAVLLFGEMAAYAQPGTEVQHRRGRIWENLMSDGYIGSPGQWDYLTSAPLGMFPGFAGWTHPRGTENNAINTYANANYHNFRSGVFIVARNLNIPGQPPSYNPTPAAFEFYASGAQGDTRGVANANNRDPIVMRRNYIESPDFNPLLPEESSFVRYNTNTGITVSRTSYVWSYPGYDDFIIYDYTFKNTGEIVSMLTAETVPNVAAFQQTLPEVYFAFHSGVSVSTKSQINFYTDLLCVQAGAFGWQPPYHDFYHVEDGETLFYSTNYNGGREPPPWNCGYVKDNRAWEQKFGSELHSPAAFGWLMLHADPRGATPRATPRPDIYRIDNHKGNPSRPQDLEFFKPSEVTPQDYYQFVTTPTVRPELGNAGDRMNIFTFSYGPYRMAPGDSVRFVLAEIAGVMDYHHVISGDPDGHFPDSTIAAIRQNAENARRVIEWGFGATVDGVAIAADAPEPPPAPEVDAVNASVGTEDAAIAVTWDDSPEQATIADGSGGVFYDGQSDLDGYRIYRSTDFQYTSDTEPPVLRGAAWTLIADIPRASFSENWDADLGRYRFVDETVQFGRRYGYYVSAYRSNPATWTSANGTVVTDLGHLESGSHNRTPPTAAAAGPVASMDIYAVPNPYVFGDELRSFGLNDPYQIEFRNLPERATIRIYSISGDLVRTIDHGPDSRGNVYGSTPWDQKSDSGLLVAPGLYIFHVESGTEGVSGRFTGKIMIVR